MDKKLKIAVYAISKNEEQFVKRFYESAKDADLIVLADTGSTDRTVELAKECGMTVYEIHVNPWRFDLPRNTALSLIPKDYDVCVSIDLDEVLVSGWREEIERLWIKGETNRMRYMYDWGNNLVFQYEKIHSRDGFVWVNMCHEVMSADPRVKENWVQTDKLMVIHKPDPNKSRRQYLELLRADVMNNPNNTRNILYYARELYFNKRWADCIPMFDRYLNQPDATWKPERAYALIYQAKAHAALENRTEALNTFRKACFENPNSRDPWFSLAEYCVSNSIWNEGFYAATQSLSITHREKVYTANPDSWGYKLYDLAAISAWNLGIKEKAVEYGKTAHELNPQDQRLETNLKWFLSAIEDN